MNLVPFQICSIFLCSNTNVVAVNDNSFFSTSVLIVPLNCPCIISYFSGPGGSVGTLLYGRWRAPTGRLMAAGYPFTWRAFCRYLWGAHEVFACAATIFELFCLFLQHNTNTARALRPAIIN